MQLNQRMTLFIVLLFILAGFVYLKSEITTTGAGSEKPQVVISLGEDLNPEQKEKVMEYFEDWEKGKEVRFITISNAEERNYLEGVVDDQIIGSRAISSAYCELLDQGKGIEVQTENITVITPFMYANALVTAGIEDARVLVAAPFEVSGTAALTGIIKAFETASGENLEENAVETAHVEMAETFKLGEKIGSSNAEKIIFEVKKRVIAENTTDPEEIKKIILEVSGDLNIELSEEDINTIISLMQKIQQLDISVGQLGKQMQNLSRELDELQNTGKEAVGLLKRLITAMGEIIAALRNLLGA